ncbi:hypothetical protein D3C71_1851860 [compost metagenome]
MVTDTLDGLGKKQQVQARRYRAWVFHHVSDEFAHEAIELLVDQIIFLEDGHGSLGVEPGKCIQRFAQQARSQLGRRAQVAGRQGPGCATFDDGAHHARHLVRLITHALQVGRGF